MKTCEKHPNNSFIVECGMCAHAASIEAAREEGRAEERLRADVAYGALSTAIAERNEARRERDEALRDLADAEQRADLDAGRKSIRTERDAALAKLAEVEAAKCKACDGTGDRAGRDDRYCTTCDGNRFDADALLAALSLPAPTALAERDARVRAEALGEAAETLETHPLGGQEGDLVFARWLRSRAEKIGG